VGYNVKIIIPDREKSRSALIVKTSPLIDQITDAQHPALEISGSIVREKISYRFRD